MSNQMQRIAELEAEIAAISAERDALRDKEPEFNLEDLADQVSDRLEQTERRLRDDFIGKFAGNFLLATETITARLIKVEEREKWLEEQQRALRAEFEGNIARMKDTLREAYNCEKDLLTWCHDVNEGYRESLAQVLAAHSESVRACDEAVKQTAHAAELCTTFADDYKSVSVIAKGELTRLVDQLRSEWSGYQRDLIRTVDAAVKPSLLQLRRFEAEQSKRKTWLLILGLITGLAFSSIFLWLTQPPRAIERDAQRWRSFTSELTREQYDKVTKLLDEIEHQQGTVVMR